MRTVTLLAAAALALPAHAQVSNPFFETGVFAPWTITPTAGGNTISSSITQYDIDGPAGGSSSNAASLSVWRTTAGAKPEGIVLAQNLSLRANVEYRFSFNWSVHAIINVHNATGGIFELMIDGVVIGSATAPVTVPGRYYGVVVGTYTATQTGLHSLGIRIRRPTLLGEEVFEYIDHARGACYPDCDGQGQLTTNDFQCFLNAYAGQLPYANCDGSTGTPAHTANDFQCYLDKFAMGCWGP